VEQVLKAPPVVQVAWDWDRPALPKSCSSCSSIARDLRGLPGARVESLRRGKALMRVHRWCPPHKGDAIGDSARRVRRLLRSMGHASEILSDVDGDLRHDVRLSQILRPGAATSRFFISRCLRRCRSGGRAAISQRHARAFASYTPALRLASMAQERSAAWPPCDPLGDSK
jgi:hypothetical protein